LLLLRWVLILRNSFKDCVSVFLSPAHFRGRGWKKGMEFKISVEPGRWELSRGVKFRGRVHAEGEGTWRGGQVELGGLNYMFGKYGSGMVLVKGAEILR